LLRTPNLGVKSVLTIEKQLEVLGFDVSGWGFRERPIKRRGPQSAAARMAFKLRIVPAGGCYKPLMTYRGIALGYAERDGREWFRVSRGRRVALASLSELTREELARYLNLAALLGDASSGRRWRVNWLQAPKDPA